MNSSLFTKVYNLRSERKGLFSLIIISTILVLLIIIGEGYVRLFSPDGYITPEIQKKKMESTTEVYSPSLFSRNVFPQKEQIIIFSIRDTFRFGLKDGYEDIVKWQINEKGYRGKIFHSLNQKVRSELLFMVDHLYLM